MNDTNQSGDTALHCSAVSGFTTLIQLLAEKGTDLNTKNGAGRTPLSLTTKGRRERKSSAAMRKASELLRKLGAQR